MASCNFYRRGATLYALHNEKQLASDGQSDAPERTREEGECLRNGQPFWGHRKVALFFVLCYSWPYLRGGYGFSASISLRQGNIQARQD